MMKWDVALVSCKFKWFLIRREEGITGASKDDSNDVMKCYKWRKPCHMMANCPLLKRKLDKLKRKKSMCVTWNKLEGSECKENSKNEDALICFMAMEKRIYEGKKKRDN